MFRGLFSLATDWRLKALAQQLIGQDASLMKVLLLGTQFFAHRFAASG